MVSSWEESFSILEKVSFEDINPHYLNALIRNQISTSISPYLNIKRVSRCQKVFVEDNGNFNFEEFIPFANALKDTKEKDLHKKIKSHLIDRLKSIENIRTKIIGCEHSSGLDSNAILGTLIYGLNLNLNNLNTFSFVSHGEKELIKDFRKFFKKLIKIILLR